MRPQHHQHALLVLALALAGCRGDSSGALPSEPRPGLLASRRSALDAPQFSDWTTAVHLDAPINSPCQDQTPTLSRDQLALYFMSNRQGGLGNDTPDGCQDTFDLWVARRPSRDSPWDNPVNLGAPVNSQFNEFHLNLSFDGRTLLFISGMNRKPNLGGFDIWMATRTPPGDVDREADELE